jgi:hypothetical protein
MYMQEWMCKLPSAFWQTWVSKSEGAGKLQFSVLAAETGAIFLSLEIPHLKNVCAFSCIAR